MYRFLFFLLAIFLFGAYSYAQVFPKEGDKLNYRIVPFLLTNSKKIDNYKIELAEGFFNNNDSFAKAVIKTVSGKERKIIITVPKFGRQYTWRVVSAKAPDRAIGARFNHFSVGTDASVDTGLTKIRVNRSSEEYKDGYVFMDGARALYDMNGEPIWYLPEMGGMIKENSMVRDLKLSCKHTITFIFEGDAFEIDYNGKILWKGPSGHKERIDSLEGYHHEFTRLSNGHYMALAFEPIARRKPPTSDSARRAMSDSLRRANRNLVRKPRYGEILEYNEAGALVWSWKSSAWLSHADLSAYKKADGMPELDPHENSFYFDEKEQHIYLSFRNISQVLKISYPDGKVLETYGLPENPATDLSSSFFCGQHSCKISEKGYLYVFDNGCDATTLPKIVMMHEPVSAKDSLRKVWEFDCPVELAKMPPPNVNTPPLNIPSRKMLFSSGGNVEELPGGHAIFASMCSPYAKLFIVSADKKVLWSAVPEKWRQGKNEWQPLQQYRASIIADPKDVEALIWNSVR